MKRMSKSVSDWVTELHVETSSSSKSTKTTKKRLLKKNSTSKKHSSGNIEDKLDETWSAKYTPTNTSELAVHKKKVAEVQQWLEFGLSCKARRPILLLTGPAGCGKTATVHALSHDMSFNVLEWYNSVDTVPVGITDKDSKFVDTEFQESQIKQFTNYIIRANKYPSLLFSSNKEVQTRKSKIVLIEELPNSILRDPSILHNILKSVKSFTYPLVFIVSDIQCTIGTSTCLFPSHIISSLDIYTIRFNPIARTNMVKALQQIVSRESKRSGWSTKDLPNKEFIEAIADCSMGDIRNAANTLQFVCLRGEKGKRRMCNENDLEQVVGGRDCPLFLFRALGKILYCKRSDDATLTDSLPPHLSEHKRTKLLIEPEEVYRYVNISNNLFNLYLHQNYLDFFDDIYDVSNVIEHMSDSDIISSVWTDSKMEKNSLDDCSTLLCCRGVMFNSTHAVSSKWRPLHKPLWSTVYKKFIDNCMSARNLFLHLGLSEHSHLWTPVELLTEILPFIAMINKSLKNLDQASLLQMVTNFRTSRKKYVALGETETEDIEQNEQNLFTKQSDVIDDDLAMGSLSQLSGGLIQDETDDIEQFDDDDYW